MHCASHAALWFQLALCFLIPCCSVCAYLAMDLDRFFEHVTLFVMLSYLRRQKRMSRNKSAIRRRYWTHPMLLKRPTEGFFALHYADLRQFPQIFFNFTRMSLPTFEFLLEKLQPCLERMKTDMRRCVPPEERLLLTLR